MEIKEIRKPAYNAKGDIDLEINHTEHGWIPYTINVDDEDETIDNSAITSIISKMDIKEYVAPSMPTDDEAEEYEKIINSL